MLKRFYLNILKWIKYEIFRRDKAEYANPTRYVVGLCNDGNILLSCIFNACIFNVIIQITLYIYNNR